MAKAEIVIGELGGGGIDLTNPDEVFRENTESFSVTFSKLPKYIVWSIAYANNGVYTMVVDIANETIRRRGYYTPTDFDDTPTFSSWITNISGTTVSFKTSATGTVFSTGMAYY